MNGSNSDAEAGGALKGKPAPKAGRRRARRWLWLTLLALAGAAVWFVAIRPERPQARAEREIHRLLAAARRQDQNPFGVHAWLERVRHWPRPFSQLANLFPGPDDWDTERLASFGQLAVPSLTNALAGDRSPAVRSLAAQALGEIGDPRLLPALIAACEREKTEPVQSSILRAAGAMGNDAAEAFLASVLQGTNAPQVRATAAGELRNPQLEQTVSALIQALATDTNQAVRRAVVRPLGYVSDPNAKAALLKAFQSDADASVCQAAARALREHPGDDTVAALIAVVRENTAPGQVLEAAISTLGQMTNAPVHPFLLETLHHPLREVRAAAARALTDFGDAKTEAALMEALASDVEPDVREAAASALGELPGAPTNRALLSALIQSLQNDPEPKVRAAVASALDRMEGNEVVGALTAALETDRKSEVQVAAIGGLYQHRGRETVSLLLQLVDNANLSTEALAEAVRCLGRTRDPSATPKLVSLLNGHREEEVRIAAATALGNLDNSNAVVALRQVLNQETATNAPAAFPVAAGRRFFSGWATTVRGAAAEALGGMETARSLETVSALAAMLTKEEDEAIRESAVKSLGQLRLTNALPALLMRLRSDPSGEVRAEAATALGRLGCVAAAPHLESAFRRDRHHRVRANAVSALALLTGAQRQEFFIAVFESDPTVRGELAGILGRIGSPKAVAVLLKSLSEDGSVNRGAVARALGLAGDARAVKPLIGILERDSDMGTRDAAVKALGWLGSAEAVPVLESALQDRRRSVQQEAAWSLGHIGEASAAGALTRALADRDSSVRFAAAFALAEVGAREAIPDLARLLGDAESQVRLAGASALAFLDDPQGLSILRDHLRSKSTWERFTALISLLRLNTPEARRLLAEGHDSDPTLAACIEAGLRLGGAGAATNMLCTARDIEDMTEDYRQFGARSLILFNDPATLPALQANANDPREEICAAVRVAIRRIQK